MTASFYRLRPLLRILRSRERNYSRVAYLLGAWLSGCRGGSGPVAWVRGWPMPDVRPGRGSIELGHVGLYPGVRLHCHGTGRMVIGDGTFLNRQARVFAGRELLLGQRCKISWQTVITDCINLDPMQGVFPAGAILAGKPAEVWPPKVTVKNQAMLRTDGRM